MWQLSPILRVLALLPLPVFGNVLHEIGGAVAVLVHLARPQCEVVVGHIWIALVSHSCHDELIKLDGACAVLVNCKRRERMSQSK